MPDWKTTAEHAASITYEAMPQSSTWSPTDHIAWVSDGSAKPPVLSRMWRRMETGEEDWHPLETIIWPRKEPETVPHT